MKKRRAHTLNTHAYIVQVDIAVEEQIPEMVAPRTNSSMARADTTNVHTTINIFIVCRSRASRSR